MYSIAIDGPSGSGKSSVAKAVASRLGILYVDTGAIYRTVGVFAKRNGIDPHDEETLSAHLAEIDIEIKWVEGTQHVFLAGDDVSTEIRLPEMSMYASAVSAIGSVRKFLLEMQREFARNNNVIMDGRDIGTVVLPDADVKIFMFANVEARAKRRYKELVLAGKDETYENVLADMIKRDKNDSERALAPCKPAEDAIMLDNSELSLEDNIERVLEIVKEKISGLL